MKAPCIEPRASNASSGFMRAVQHLEDEAAVELQTAQAKAYNTLLDTVNHLAHERNRFDAEADGERWRRARAERALAYSHRWCGVLLVIIVFEGLLGLAILVVVNIR